jgi:hypothetical protein
VLEPLAEQSFRPDWAKVKSIQVSAVEGRVQFSRTP